MLSQTHSYIRLQLSRILSARIRAATAAYVQTGKKHAGLHTLPSYDQVGHNDKEACCRSRGAGLILGRVGVRRSGPSFSQKTIIKRS